MAKDIGKEKDTTQYAYLIIYDNEEMYEDADIYPWNVAFTSVEAAEECLYEEGYTRKDTPTPKFRGSKTYYTQPLYTQKELGKLLKRKDKDGEKMYYDYEFSGEEKYNIETGEREFLGYRLSGLCTIKAVPLLESINELGETDIYKAVR